MQKARVESLRVDFPCYVLEPAPGQFCRDLTIRSSPSGELNFHRKDLKILLRTVVTILKPKGSF